MVYCAPLFVDVSGVVGGRIVGVPSDFSVLLSCDPSGSVLLSPTSSLVVLVLVAVVIVFDQ